MNLLFSSPSLLSLFSLKRRSGAFINFRAFHWKALSFTEEPRTDHSTPAVASPVLMRAKGSPPSTPGNTHPNAAHDTTVLPCHKGTVLSHIQLGDRPRLAGLFRAAAFPISTLIMYLMHEVVCIFLCRTY